MNKGSRLKIAIVLCLVLIITISASFFLLFHATANASKDYWNNIISGNTYALKFVETDENHVYYQDGFDGYYEISSNYQFAYFNKNLSAYYNKKIVLTCDIDMGAYYYQPNQSYAFSGVFEGNNNTISNIDLYYDTVNYSNNGLFAKIDYGGQVQNLILDNFQVKNVGKRFGCIAGYCEGANGKPYNIFNCQVNNGSVQYYSDGTSKTAYFGGIVGFSYCSVIKSCFVDNLTASSSGTNQMWTEFYLGGIVGEANNTEISVCRLTNSKLTGFVRKNDAVVYVGGIAGALSSKNNSTTKSLIEKCYCSGGYISAGNSAYKTRTCAGGIAGYVDYGDIENCYNTARVCAESSKHDSTTSIDGMKNGNMVSGTYYSAMKCRLTDQGSTDKSTFENSYCGGIVGYYKYPDGNIKNCYNLRKLQYYYDVSANNWYYRNIVKNEYELNLRIENNTKMPSGAAYPYVGYNNKIRILAYSPLWTGGICGSGIYGLTKENCFFSEDCFVYEPYIYSISYTCNGNTQNGEMKNYITFAKGEFYYKFILENTTSDDTQNQLTLKLQIQYVTIKDTLKTNTKIVNVLSLFGLKGGYTPAEINTLPNLSSAYVLDTSISDTPILKDFYWKHCGEAPPEIN